MPGRRGTRFAAATQLRRRLDRSLLIWNASVSIPDLFSGTADKQSRSGRVLVDEYGRIGAACWGASDFVTPEGAGRILGVTMKGRLPVLIHYAAALLRTVDSGTRRRLARELFPALKAGRKNAP